MIVVHIAKDLRERLPTWDRSSQIALLLAVTLLPLMLILGFWGPDQIQVPARMGGFGLLVTLQLVILWGNRGMVTDYTKAQRHFIKGEFEVARDILEALPVTDKPSADALTLLANTYRHLGQLDASYKAAQAALAIEPDYHFALYGMGRTLLEMGQYTDASNFITKALFSGAPLVVKFDLGHSYYRQGENKLAQQSLLEAIDLIHDEAYRELMARYLLHQLGEQQHLSPSLIESGLPFWEASAKRFAHTPYGIALQTDVETLRMWLKEN